MTTWPKPNRHGVYVPGETPGTDSLTCNPGAAQGKTRRLAVAPVATIHVVQTGPEEWRSSHSTHTSHGDMRGGGAFPSKYDQPFPTRQAAIDHEATEIIACAEELISDCDREEARFRRDQAELKAGKRTWVADRNNTPEQRKEAELALAWARDLQSGGNLLDRMLGDTPAIPNERGWTDAELHAAHELHTGDDDELDDFLENASPQDLLDWLGGLVNEAIAAHKDARTDDEREQATAWLEEIKTHVENVLEHRPQLAPELVEGQMELAFS